MDTKSPWKRSLRAGAYIFAGLFLPVFLYAVLQENEDIATGVVTALFLTGASFFAGMFGARLALAQRKLVKLLTIIVVPVTLATPGIASIVASFFIDTQAGYGLERAIMVIGGIMLILAASIVGLLLGAMLVIIFWNSHKKRGSRTRH